MSEYIGNIAVPEISVSGVFPIEPDIGWGMGWEPEIAVHTFGSGDARSEQRFLLGTGGKKFTIRKAALRDADRIALRDFWESQ